MQQEKDKDRVRIEKLIRSVPKAEIHLHLEGLVSADSLWHLIQENELQIDGIKSREDLVKKFRINSLDEFIWLFINIIQDAFRKPEDLTWLIKDARDYLLRNNIVYAEIFFAPTKFVQNGFDFGSMMNILHKGAQQLKKDENIEIRFLIDVSRTYGVENAEQNLKLTLQNLNESIIGIGLGGSESQGPAEEFTNVFQKAIEAGLKVVAHAGEDIESSSIWNSINYLKAERIGHGISARDDEKLMKYLAETQLPLEICPTSNIFTKKYVQKLEEHPIRMFFDKSINVTLNTDDPTLFGIELVEEYINLFDYLDFSVEEMLQIIKNTIFATFLNKKAQEDLWKRAAKVIKKSGFQVP